MRRGRVQIEAATVGCGACHSTGVSCVRTLLWVPMCSQALQTQGKGRVKYLSLMVDRVADHNARLLRRVAQLEDQLRNAKWGGALGHGGRGVEPIGTTPLLDTTVIVSMLAVLFAVTAASIPLTRA